MDRVDGIPEAMSDRTVPYDLEQFFGAYFHQDWPLEADDWQQIVDRYSASSTRTPQHLRALASHIDGLRDQSKNSDLPTIMMEIGGFYDPRPEMTYSEWLIHVAERLRQNAAMLDDEGAGGPEG
ncbi:contact-dependent growth inhibition system immunity protein [Mycobacterium sp. WMMD1722]|uniref:contact-dependent growth inhibition system immunity protein n=1 Tax=Mycobacterium sp. WMMD1722 TaxID=3404117 RepID=UPI003BF46520